MPSDLEHSAPERDGYGMCPIIGAKLADNILDVEIDGGLGNSQFIGDLFIAMSIPDQPEDFKFSSRKTLLPKVLSQS